MSISDESLATELYRAGIGIDDALLSATNRKKWLNAARRAREVLYAELRPQPSIMTDGGLAARIRLWSTGNDDWEGASRTAKENWISVARKVRAELRPEPDWQLGDMAQDARGTIYVRTDIARSAGQADQWLDVRSGTAWTRDQIPGALIPCDVVPREAIL